MEREKTPTTHEAVTAYETTHGVFESLFAEIKELSKKKSDATMSKFKVSQINRILIDIKAFLGTEPEAKYLDVLDDEVLPQVGDAVVVMAQFQAALDAFKQRHTVYEDYQHVWYLEKGRK